MAGVGRSGNTTDPRIVFVKVHEVHGRLGELCEVWPGCSGSRWRVIQRDGALRGIRHRQCRSRHLDFRTRHQPIYRRLQSIWRTHYLSTASGTTRLKPAKHERNRDCGRAATMPRLPRYIARRDSQIRHHIRIQP
jgi:hypothetical protein